MANITGFFMEPFIKLEVAPLTGSTTVVNAPYNWVVYTNPGTIAAQTLTLPTAPVDGQILMISNFSIITAFTMSPAATGFTNASALSAGQGLTVAYSANTLAWFCAAF